MDIGQRVLAFGDTQLLRRLATALRDSPLLEVVERGICDEITDSGKVRPDVILVDGGKITPEQFHELLDTAHFSQSTLIGIDPLTYQLTVLSASYGARPLERIAQVIEILSLTLSQPT